jgi:hypothetical protein
MEKKKTKFWIALAVPFAFIILILIKIYHTVDVGSNDPFTKKGGMVFTFEQFSQNIEVGLPISNALEASVRTRDKSDILKIIEERKLISKKNSQYHWLAIAVKDESEENWKVTFREKGITPKMQCTSSLNIKTGISTGFKCLVK